MCNAAVVAAWQQEKKKEIESYLTRAKATFNPVWGKF